MKPGHTRSWRPGAIAQSFVYAIRGLGVMLWEEPNGRVHVVSAAIVLIVSALLPLSRTDWCWIVASIAAVWAAEAFNTAIETVVDLASPEMHPLAARAKDVSAGAVLVTAVAATIVGALVLWPHVYVTWMI